MDHFLSSKARQFKILDISLGKNSFYLYITWKVCYNYYVHKIGGAFMKKIDEQIQWYEQNATRKDDDLIKANLKLIDNLYGEIENSEDKIFLDKIIGTFCEIMEIQRDVIVDVKTEMGYYDVPNQHNFVVTYSQHTEFINDKQLQEAFTAYCLKAGKSSYTVNDYCSRIKNVWKSFYAENQNGYLPEELEVNEEKINSNNPLLNAYYHADELHCYISMKIAGFEGNRNWLNARAALNKFDEFKSSLI